MASVRPPSMPLDVLSLQSFYGSPLGGVARRLVGRVIGERWETSAGLSVAAFDLGAPAERIRRARRGWLLPLGLPPPAINNALLALRGIAGDE